MRKITVILFSVFIILSINTNVHAQSVKLGVGGGLTQVLGPDTWTNDVGSGGIGLSSEYNLGVVAKVGLPIIPLTPRAFILYHNMNGSGSLNGLAKGNNVTSNAEFSRTLWSIGLGVQYGFIPVPLGFDPYLSLDLSFNSFGDAKSIINEVESNFGGFSRMGLQLGVGTEISIVPMVNLDVFAGYHWFNLTGKEDGEDTISALVVDVYVIFNFL